MNRVTKTSIVVVVVAFLAYVATRPSHFTYSRSGLIDAPESLIFKYVSDLNRGSEWTPYEQKDPNMKKIVTGEAGQVGMKMEFDGNNEVGTGTLTITNVIPNKRVDLLLDMTSPMTAHNNITYTLIPEANGTRFTWSMHGDGGWMFKIVQVFIDCEQMVTKDFEVGIANLKKVVEDQVQKSTHL